MSNSGWLRLALSALSATRELKSASQRGLRSFLPLDLIYFRFEIRVRLNN